MEQDPLRKAADLLNTHRVFIADRIIEVNFRLNPRFARVERQSLVERASEVVGMLSAVLRGETSDEAFVEELRNKVAKRLAVGLRPADYAPWACCCLAVCRRVFNACLEPRDAILAYDELESRALPIITRWAEVLFGMEAERLEHLREFDEDEVTAPQMVQQGRGFDRVDFGDLPFSR